MSSNHIPSDRRDFNCEHCGKKISIPRNLPATTGPCPHCKKKVTSPPPPRAGRYRPTRAEDTATAPAQANKAPATTPTQPSNAVKLTAADRAARNAEALPRKPVVSRPLETERGPLDPHQLETLLREETTRHRRTMVLMLVVIGTGIAGGIGYFHHLSRQQADEPMPPVMAAPDPEPWKLTPQFIEGGWEPAAREVLREFLSANNRIGKLPHILRAEELLPDLVDFYHRDGIEDLDTPASAFVAQPLSAEDHHRGLFRLASTSVRADLDPELVSRLVATGDDTTPDPAVRQLVDPQKAAEAPTHVHAFFMHTPEGLKLDWEVFVQTKYRTLLNFATNPQSRRQPSFRVLIAQDRPNGDAADDGVIRYRIADPANRADVVRATAKATSDAAKALSSIHWVGIDGRQPVTRTATVKLAWRHDGPEPELVIHRFLCWEFLGLGGKTATSDTESP